MGSPADTADLRTVKLFDDTEWAQRTHRRAEGPFAMIRYVVTPPVGVLHYRAYAEDHEFLMRLTHESLMELAAEQFIEVRARGWKPGDRYTPGNRIRPSLAQSNPPLVPSRDDPLQPSWMGKFPLKRGD